jgi:hypothetical protein
VRRMILRYVHVETVAVLVTAWLAGALGLALATDAGAVPTAALMALGTLLGGLLLLIRHSLDLANRIGNLAGQSTRTFETVRRVEADTQKELKQTFRQLEALQNLNAVLPTSDVLPATRGWAASPDLLLALVDLVITERPSLIVECGSGASTLWLALALRRFGIGETYPWYARTAWEDLAGIDLLFVDGPPAATGPQARYPALPLLNKSLSTIATVVLDDLILPDMREVLARWLDADPDFSSEILPLEKQAAVLRRT